MCTAIGINTKRGYLFGRTLDVPASYGEKTVVTPRDFPINFRRAGGLTSHYALIGRAVVAGGLPLYYDAMNEFGLCMAGLNFPGNAVYFAPSESKKSVASFELILYVLGQCKNVSEARALLENVSLLDEDFSPDMKNTPLHWLIGDGSGEIAVESVKEGLKIYDDPAGVLTNNPPFEAQLFNLRNYARLSTQNPQNSFAPALDLAPYSRGMGALGMPGDWSSPSRFVRAAFVKYNHPEPENYSDFLRILGSAVVPKGCVDIGGSCQYTVYSSCCDAAKGQYVCEIYDGTRTCATLKGNESGRTLGIFE